MKNLRICYFRIYSFDNTRLDKKRRRTATLVIIKAYLTYESDIEDNV